MAARAELAARAAAAQDRVGVNLYTFAQPGGPEWPVLVVRAADRTWRVDIPGGALGESANISIVETADGLYHCQTTEPVQCMMTEGLTPAVDPVVQHVFTDWLEVLTDDTAPVSVVAASENCFSVEPTTISVRAPLAGGLYCFEPDGTLTGAKLTLGTLTLVDRAVPATVELPGPVVSGPTDS